MNVKQSSIGIEENAARRLVGHLADHAFKAVPDTLLPHLSIRVPQCGHIHSPSSTCDLKIGTRRSDIGVAQLEQRSGFRSFARRWRRILASSAPSATTITMGTR
jgi:hypothetical protein